ncbi:hypothetical protein C8J56DRAFT_1043059 [Mycena floridula]|nr:hypothetical protein C8J56DRAFT_1043059 [Mycena floridula]
MSLPPHNPHLTNIHMGFSTPSPFSTPQSNRNIDPRLLTQVALHPTMRTPTHQAVFQPAGAADSSPFGGSSSTAPSSPSPPHTSSSASTAHEMWLMTTEKRPSASNTFSTDCFALSALSSFAAMALIHVIQADQLSNETSGWLYVVGHHPNLRHEYIHYCSPCLSNEGGQALNDVHAAVDDLFTALQMSHRTEATELGAQLAQQQRENEQLRKRLAAAEAQLGP